MEPDLRSRPIESAPLPALDALLALDDAACAAVRAALERAGYGQELLEDAERIAPLQLDAVRLPLVHWWLEQHGGPASTIARLFSYAAPVAAGDARSALGEPVFTTLTRAGVLEPSARTGQVRSPFRIVPLEGIFVLSDPPEAGGEAVMGPGITTLDLVRMLPRAPSSVLDLGCGAGTLALLAARRGARRAVGVDLSPRAVAMARFNARLNGLAAEFAAGDLLAPVAGEHFDLILSQPPYVVHPPRLEATTYLHGGPRGDELALRFAAAAASALTRSGRAILLFDSAMQPGKPLHARVRAALGAAAVDLAVMTAPGPSADLQAVAYASLQDPALGEAYRDAVRLYREHLEDIGAREFTRALLVLVDSGEPGGRFTVSLPVASLSRIDAATLEHFLRGIELAGAAPEVLRRARVAVAPGARLVEERDPTSPAETSHFAIRFAAPGIAGDRELGEGGVALFAALRTEPSVEAAAKKFADACGEPIGRVARQVEDFVREGLARGMLVETKSSVDG